MGRWGGPQSAGGLVAPGVSVRPRHKDSGIKCDLSRQKRCPNTHHHLMRTPLTTATPPFFLPQKSSTMSRCAALLWLIAHPCCCCCCPLHLLLLLPLPLLLLLFLLLLLLVLFLRLPQPHLPRRRSDNTLPVSWRLPLRCAASKNSRPVRRRPVLAACCPMHATSLRGCPRARRTALRCRRCCRRRHRRRRHNHPLHLQNPGRWGRWTGHQEAQVMEGVLQYALSPFRC